MTNPRYEVNYSSAVHGRCQTWFNDLEDFRRWIRLYDPDGENGTVVYELVYSGPAVWRKRTVSSEELWGVKLVKALPIQKTNWSEEGF